MPSLLALARKVGARITFELSDNAVLLGKSGAVWVVLDAKPCDPTRSRYRYNRRLTIARIDPASIPEGAQRIPWMWDKPRKRVRETA